MNMLAALNFNPNLQRILMNSKLLDIIPGGFSIATDVSCETIIHNPVTANFLRIEPYGLFSHSAKVPPPVKVYQKGKFIPAEDMPIEQAAWYGKETVGCELEFVWEDGISKIARWNASPLRNENGIICGCIATMEDITDVVQMTRELQRHEVHLEEMVHERTDALQKSEERFAKVFLNNPQALSIYRSSDFRLLEANYQFSRALNVLPEELIGKSPIELGLPESEFSILMDVLEKQESIHNLEICYLKGNAKKVSVFLSAEHIQLNGEECILVSSSNITEMKKMQDDIARLDRLNLVVKMAAGIAHEIRNPMTAVRGYLQLLEKKPEFEYYGNTLELMISEIDRANSIITEYLSLARNAPTDSTSININDILSNLYPLLEAEAYNQSKQVVFLAGDTPDILMSSKEITQMILNLARNGLDAMREQGTLTIRTYTKDEQVVLAVQDEGIGIPQENLEKLGIPFFTTKENGTGLGLASSYSIIERHKGKIEVESGPAGTIFFVYFPIQVS